MKKSKVIFLFIIALSLVVTNIQVVEAKAEELSIPILMYHNLTYNDKVSDGLNVPRERFEEQIQYLKIHGYNTIDFHELGRYFKGEIELPPNPIIITFDDGYVTNYTYGYPILKKYGYKATVFMITDYIGKDGYLNIDMLKKMETEGVFDVQSHSVNHLYELSSTSTDKMIYEVKTSKDALDEILDKNVNVFCYPFGKNSEKLKNVLKDQGYKFAVTTKYGGVNKNDDYFRLNRLRVFGTDSGKTLKGRIEKITKTYAKKVAEDIEITDKDFPVLIESIHQGWLELVDGKLLPDDKASLHNFINSLTNILNKDIVIDVKDNQDITIEYALEVISKHLNILHIDLNNNFSKESIELKLAKGLDPIEEYTEVEIPLTRRNMARILDNLQNLLNKYVKLYDDIIEHTISKDDMYIIGNYYTEDKQALDELYLLTSDANNLQRITFFNDSSHEDKLDVEELFICSDYKKLLIRTKMIDDNKSSIYFINIDTSKVLPVIESNIVESIKSIYWIDNDKFTLQISDSNSEKVLIYDNNITVIDEIVIELKDE